jgi:diphthamide biosynthesis protein 7
MEEGTLLKPFISTTLDLPPSCIEFSRVSPEFFVVGTYNLEKDDGLEEPQENEDNESATKVKKTQERNGSLVLYGLENDEL